MKKVLLFALVVIISGTALAANRTENVNENIRIAFRQEFNDAREVEWTSTTEFVRARFISDHQVMYAYYKHTGELMAVTRYISRSQLPLELATSLKERFGSHCLVELFELSQNDETSYYVSLRDSKCLIMLEAKADGSWHLFKKQKL